MNEKTKIMIIAAVVVVLAFVGGTAYGKHSANKKTTTMMAGQFGNAQGRGTFGGAATAGGMRGGNGGLVTGTVISKDANGITVQGQTGSKIVLVSPSTTVAKSAAGSIDDVTVGSSVTVIGATNGDGSVTAQSVQIRPSGMQK